MLNDTIITYVYQLNLTGDDNYKITVSNVIFFAIKLKGG